MVSSVQNETYSPSISVIMPVYNAAKYLSGAIESVLSQTFTSFEFIIIDDFSVDGSRKIIDYYANSDHRINCIFHEKNIGNYPSRNEGIANAKGKFVAVMDADDLAMPERFRVQMNELQKDDDLVLVGSQVILIDPKGRQLGLKENIPLEHDDINKKLINGEWAIIHPSVMMRKTAVNEMGGYRERFRSCADHDLYLRISEIGKVRNLPEILLNYRQHYSSMTMNQTDQRYNLYFIKMEARERRGLASLQDEPVPEIGQVHKFSNKEKMAIHYDWAKKAFSSSHFKVALIHLFLSFILHPLEMVNKGVSSLCSRVSNA